MKLNGFTLIELMIAVAVLSILAALAAPSFASFIQEEQSNKHTTEFIGQLSQLRAQAFKTSQRLIMCQSNDGTSCSNQTSDATQWQTGYIGFIRQNQNSQSTSLPDLNASTPDIMLFSSAIDDSVAVRTDFGDVLALTFEGAQNSAQFKICNEQLSGQAIEIWVSGQQRYQAISGAACQ